MNKLVTCLVFATLMISCKSKKKKENKTFFSVLNYLQAQVKQLDTGNYRFTRIETLNGITDTTEMPKSEVSARVHDFISLPDISAAEQKDNYEEANTYDETLGNVLLTYTAKNPDEAVRSETVMLEPDSSGNTRPVTILINWIESGKDSTVVKDMTWHVNKRFQIVTKTSKPGQQEQIRTLAVKWE
jgi:cell division protein YceG involved in septum cleavage